MKVLVTGTGGRVGSAVAREFLEHGHSVRALDQNAPAKSLREGLNSETKARFESVYADISDRMALLKAAEGCDAIAHLAAIPHPQHGEERIFQTNVLGTQYVFNAAEANGIGSVALASSACAFGFAMAHHPFDPNYLPLNEDHPSLTQDMYGLSKKLNEETAATYTRRCGMATFCLRFPFVADFEGHNHWQRRSLQNSGKWRSNDYWTYVDIRDAARSFRVALEKSTAVAQSSEVHQLVGGHHVLLIAARDSFTPHDIRDLVRKYYPARIADVRDLDAQASLYDTGRAETVLGFVPQHSWRDNEDLLSVAAEPLDN